MKALTLTQPWATLVALGAKRIETRSWPTEYRGRIAIHAAKGFPADARYVVGESPFQGALRAGFNRSPVLATELPVSSIIAIATLRDCFRFNGGTSAAIRARSSKGTLPPNEADFGFYDAGRYGFVMDNVVALREPVPARGMLGLWNVPGDVAALIGHQLDEMGVAA